MAACRGCHDAALAYGAPYVSGKDSLYNEFVHPDGTTRSGDGSTLIITAVGVADDVDHDPRRRALSRAGNDVWLLGPATGLLGGGHLDEVTGGDQRRPPARR